MNKLFLFFVAAKLIFAATTAEWIELDSKIFIHQIFHIDLKFIKSKSANISLHGGKNIKYIASETLKTGDLYIFKRYYFEALGKYITIPQAIVRTNSYIAKARPLELLAEKLQPPKNFCNVLAKKLTLKEYETVQYNKDLNLIVMKIIAREANLEDFSLPFAKQEGIKKLQINFPIANLIYYAIIPNSLKTVKFVYFNTSSYEFKPISITIKVNDETVSTQSDIKPSEDKNKKTKIILIGILTTLLIILFIWKRNIFILLLAIVSALYTIYMLMPKEKVCVKPGSNIYILPTKQSTVFEVNQKKQVFEALKHVGHYIKIKLSKERVGWVRDEDICKN